MFDLPPERMLDEIIAVCDTAAGVYATSSGRTTDGELATLFATLAAARRDMAAGLSGQTPGTARWGTATVEPPRRFLIRLRAAWKGDQRHNLIDDCERSDRALARRLAEAGGSPWPPSLGKTLRHLHSDVTASLGLLAAARTRLM